MPALNSPSVTNSLQPIIPIVNTTSNTAAITSHASLVTSTVTNKSLLMNNDIGSVSSIPINSIQLNNQSNSSHFQVKLNTTSQSVQNELNQKNSTVTSTQPFNLIIQETSVSSSMPPDVLQLATSNNKNELNPSKRPRTNSNTKTGPDTLLTLSALDNESTEVSQSGASVSSSTNSIESSTTKSSSQNNKAKNKMFKWPAYIEETKCQTAPVYAFKHAPLAEFWKKITTNIVIELPNPDMPPHSPKAYWFAQVIEYQGYLAKLRYIGYENDARHDFWMHMCDSEVHHVCWSTENDINIVPPEAIIEDREDWKAYVLQKIVGFKTIPKDFHKKVV